MDKTILEKAIEDKTGLPVDVIRRSPLSDLRKYFEGNGKMRVVHSEPDTISHEDVEKMLDEVLK